MADKTLQRIIDRVNEMLGSISPEVRYTYWETKGKCPNYRTVYTTNRVGGKFIAALYKHVKKANDWKMIKEVKFAKRWEAKERAYKWYCQKQGKKVPKSPVFHREISEERKEQLREQFLERKSVMIKMSLTPKEAAGVQALLGEILNPCEYEEYEDYLTREEWDAAGDFYGKLAEAHVKELAEIKRLEEEDDDEG